MLLSLSFFLMSFLPSFFPLLLLLLYHLLFSTQVLFGVWMLLIGPGLLLWMLHAIPGLGGFSIDVWVRDLYRLLMCVWVWSHLRAMRYSCTNTKSLCCDVDTRKVHFVFCILFVSARACEFTVPFSTDHRDHNPASATVSVISCATIITPPPRCPLDAARRATTPRATFCALNTRTTKNRAAVGRTWLILT